MPSCLRTTSSLLCLVQHLILSFWTRFLHRQDIPYFSGYLRYCCVYNGRDVDRRSKSRGSPTSRLLGQSTQPPKTAKQHIRFSQLPRALTDGISRQLTTRRASDQGQVRPMEQTRRRSSQCFQPLARDVDASGGFRGLRQRRHHSCPGAGRVLSFSTGAHQLL